jgi:hypothetical protein
LGQDLFDSLYLNDKQINRFISLGVAKSPRWSATLSVDYSNTDERIVIDNDRKNNAIEKALDTLWDTSLTWANFEMVFNVNQKPDYHYHTDHSVAAYFAAMVFADIFSPLRMVINLE